MSKQVQNPLHTPLSRRQALKVMGGFASMAALAACVAPAAPAGSTATEGAAPAAAPGSLLVAHRAEYFKEMETLFIESVQAWGAANNTEIETTVVASEAFEDFVAKTVAQVQAGEPPDLLYHVRLVQQLYSLDALEPVTDAVEQAEGLYGKAPYGQSANNVIDGQWYGIPYIMSGGGAFGRRDIFEANGIDVETLTTYDSRREACLAVSKPDEEIYGWGVTVNKSGDGRGFIEGVIQNWGGSYTDEGMTQIVFNSPETIAAVEWLTEIYTTDQFAPMLPPGIISWTDSSNNEAYLAGNVAYTHNAASVYAKAKADGNPVFENTYYFETATGPLGQKLEAGGGGQFNVPKGAKNPDAAKALALYMITPEVFLPISLISAGLFLPAYPKIDEMPEVQAGYEADPNLARMSAATKGSHPGSSWPAQPSPYFDAIQAQAILEDMMAQTVTQGVPAADAVAQAAERMQQLADELGALTQ